MGNQADWGRLTPSPEGEGGDPQSGEGEGAHATNLSIIQQATPSPANATLSLRRGLSLAAALEHRFAGLAVGVLQRVDGFGGWP